MLAHTAAQSSTSERELRTCTEVGMLKMASTVHWQEGGVFDIIIMYLCSVHIYMTHYAIIIKQRVVVL